VFRFNRLPLLVLQVSFGKFGDNGKSGCFLLVSLKITVIILPTNEFKWTVLVLGLNACYESSITLGETFCQKVF